MPDKQPLTTEQAPLEQLYAYVGEVPKDDLVSEARLQERREEAARGKRAHE